MAKLTIKDIAKAVGVSVSTVSKALSDSYEISDATKQRVLEYARKHEYVPNRFAKNLRKGKTNSIGVIVSNISNTFISQVLQSIQTNLEKRGVFTLIVQSHYDAKTERDCIENIIQRGVDGILISPVHVNSNLDLLEKIQKTHPVVIFDRIESDLKAFKVGIDNVDGGYLATRHLLRNGRRKIAFIYADKLGISHTRYQGYKRALKEYGLTSEKENTLSIGLGNYTTLDNQLMEFAKSRLKTQSIDGMVCAAETIATRGLGVLAQAGITVPSEIAVVGFANTSFAFSLNPPLTTLVQPADEMGEIAVAKMMDLLSNQRILRELERIELKSVLEIRNSCGYSLK